MAITHICGGAVRRFLRSFVSTWCEKGDHWAFPGWGCGCRCHKKEG